nr:tRNA pseudouridine(38-40) synthase TruA [Paenibacillus hamazuiensis]
MTVSYDGTAYNGFQTQPGGNTIQDHIEAALHMLTGERIPITASGRTDAGVHARGQVLNFHTASQIPLERWCMAINSRLPDDIQVTDAREVSEEFHARRSALQKTYRYTILNGKYKDVFRRNMEYHHYSPLDVSAMREALRHLLGEHDFTSFCSARTEKLSKVRTIYAAAIREEPCEAMANSTRLYIEITGNGFLYNMVRIIVGTLIEIGEGKRKPGDMEAILKSQNRKMAGPTAMAHGLMLWEVLYPE